MIHKLFLSFLLYIVVTSGHAIHNRLWECQCWDYTVFKRNTRTPTVQPVVQPTHSPLPAAWPAFLKPGFFDRP